MGTIGPLAADLLLDEVIVQHLGEKVMGYRHDNGGWLDSDGNVVYFHPLTSLQDTFRLVDAVLRQEWHGEGIMEFVLASAQESGSPVWRASFVPWIWGEGRAELVAINAYEGVSWSRQRAICSAAVHLLAGPPARGEVK